MEQLSLHLNACYLGIFFKDKGLSHIGDRIGLSSNTLYNYKKQWPPTRQTLKGLYKRIDYSMGQPESTSMVKRFPQYVAESKATREKLKNTDPDDVPYDEAVTYPQRGMTVANFPHSFLLMTELAWTDILEISPNSPELVELELRKTRIGSDKAKELADLLVGKEFSQQKKEAFLVLLDVWVLSAFIEDLEHLTDCELVEPCVLKVFDRLFEGESLESLTKWSIQQFWKGNESEVDMSWKLFHDGLETQTGDYPDAVKSKVKAWQKGRLLTIDQVALVGAIIGFRQMIPMLVVALIRTTNPIGRQDIRPSWYNLDLAGDIRYWRVRIHQAARDTPGLTINPRGTFYIKP